ncbi:PREDICTED: WAP four-disulfide core domain protein 13 [Mandrillus leucophaeus]|uniref:WAP four-disulfide core domain 13 n=1 Tax=Mandrillus leucophaeus TaxID=9568 RepID=A0A2K6A3Z0_MANLE|nr:PREDICTED: WAP four-disulfide core domain protein 13 [Mandrillus leucophaeus]
MKPVLPLQFLVVFCLALQLVPGSPKERALKYILEPPPCISAPENCTQLCTMQEDCQKGFQCCSSFCGIVCSSDTLQKRKRYKPKGSEVIMPTN